jgi:hypothetical protein
MLFPHLFKALSADCYKNIHMQKTLLTLITLLFLTITFGQKTEYRIALNSGLFSLTGRSAVSTSVIDFDNFINSGYTNNPFGSNVALCYGLSGDIKRVSKKNLVVGVDLGYEYLRSEVLLNEIVFYPEISTMYSAKGKTFLNYGFINFYPYIGHRFNSKKFNFDVTGGFDIGYCLKTHEGGNATDSAGTKYTASLDKKRLDTDIRPRIQFSLDYSKVGAYIGYSYGLKNYASGYVDGSEKGECYARIVRFGLTYQVN